jgi:hypothetical protein
MVNAFVEVEPNAGRLLFDSVFFVVEHSHFITAVAGVEVELVLDA